MRAQEINAIRVYRDAEELKAVYNGHDITYLRLNQSIHEFIDPSAEPLYDLVNEMVLSYLQRTVIPLMGNRGVSAAADLLFPDRTPDLARPRPLDVRSYRHFMQPEARPIPNFDSAYVCNRIRAFLSRFSDGSVVFEDRCVAGITRSVAYMLTMVLEMANVNSIYWGFDIMPSHVRLAVANDDQMYERFRYSLVYWDGRTQRLTVQ